jgi:hypothetical protein
MLIYRRRIVLIEGTSLVTESGVLHLYNVSVYDSGNYWCTVTNHITTDTNPANSFTRLVVQPKVMSPRRAPEFLIKPKPYFVVPKGMQGFRLRLCIDWGNTKFTNLFYLADGNVTLECVAIGNPPPFITWRKLRSSSMTNYKSSHGSLNLYNVDFAQEGEYICEAYNNVGDALTTLSTVVLNSKFRLLY